MENLNSLKENNKELYDKLFKYDCKVTFNNKLIYEGKFNEQIDLGKYNPSQIVFEFNINNKHILILGEENKNIEKLYELFKDKEFEIIYEDFKLFNKCMNLANSLPLYNLSENIYEEETKKKFKKYGSNFQKIYENLIILRNEKYIIHSNNI